ncbi:MAG: hypothetical protein JSR52_06255 [Planctomycetes bacterium]|nr:hypothetical protein [Planctomycetota bacterium]
MSSAPVFAPRVGAGTAAAIRYTPQTSAAFAPRSSAGMMRASADFPAPPPASSVPSVPSVPRVQPPMAPANQFPTGPSNLPGTLPALNSNTLPALNSNTLPALNSNTLPALNSNTLPALNSNTAPLLNSGVVPILNSGTSPSLNSGTLPVLHSPAAPGFNGTTSSAALANLPQATPTTPSGNACPLPPPNPGCPVYCPPGWNWFPYYNSAVLWNGTNYVVYYNGYPVPTYVPGPFGGVTYLYDSNLLPGGTLQQAPQTQPQSAQPPTPTPFDIGIAAFRSGQAQAAARILNDVVTRDREDTSAMRILSLALLELREPDNAAAMMRQAYRIDPTLCSQIIDSDALGLSASRRTTLINRASEYANRVGSASGWLTVAVLMQADGRYELARKMLKKAANEGLEPAVVNAFEAAIATKLPLSAPRQSKPVAPKPTNQTTAQPPAPAAAQPAAPAMGEPDPSN